MVDLVSRINELYDAAVAPDPNAGAFAPTNEPYITYAIGILKMDAIENEVTGVRFILESMLYSTFVALRWPCAPVKPEGTPVVYQNLISQWHLPVAHRYLYWRRLPEIQSTDTLWEISCRALVSQHAPKE